MVNKIPISCLSSLRLSLSCKETLLGNERSIAAMALLMSAQGDCTSKQSWLQQSMGRYDDTLPRTLWSLREIAAPRWGSRPRPQSRHAFYVHRYHLYGTRSGEEGFPRRDIYSRLPRKEFPRDYGSPLSRMWWIEERTPRLLITLIYYVFRYPFWRMQHPREHLEKGVVVKSLMGCLFYEFVTHSNCRVLINETIRPVGYLAISRGASMLPTIGENPSILYTSYAYVESRDVHCGDVVIVITGQVQ